MTAKAKVFQSGHSQAVRLPKAFRFKNVSEVWVTRSKNGGITLTPKEDDRAVWDSWFEAIGGFSDDFMRTRVQPPLDEGVNFDTNA